MVRLVGVISVRGDRVATPFKCCGCSTAGTASRMDTKGSLAVFFSNRFLDIFRAHRILLFADRGYSFGFYCLVPRAALGVKETEQLFQRLGTRCVPEECPVAPHLDQVLVLQLVEVVR